MRQRSVIYCLLLLCLLFTFQLTLHAAQDSFQWHLPEGAIARLGKGPVNNIAFSPDGNHLAVVSDIGVWIYDALIGTEQALLTAHTNRAVYDVAFSPNGHTIAVTGDRQKVQLWDIRTQTLKGTLDGHTHWPVDVAFSPDGQTIAIADLDQTTQLWDVNTMTLKCMLEDSADIPENEGMELFNIAYGPNGDTFAIGAEDGTVSLWNTAAGKIIHSFNGNITSEESFSFSPNGRTIAMQSFSNKVLLLDTTTGKQIKTFEEGIDILGNSIAYSPNGDILAITARDGLQLWDATIGKRKNTLKHTLQIQNMAFSPDGNTIATVCSQQKKFWYNDSKTVYNYLDYNIVWLWDTATGKHKRTLEGTDSVERIAFSPDGNMLAMFNADNTVQVWNTQTWTLKYTIEHTSSVVGSSFSPGMVTLITVHTNKRVWSWDIQTHRPKHAYMLTKHTDDVCSVAFNPDGNTIATGSLDGSMLLWDAISGEFKETVLERQYTTESVYVGPFSHDGNTLALRFGTGVKLLGMAPTRVKKIINKNGKYTRSVAFSPAGNIIAVQMDDRLLLLDIATERVVFTLEQVDRETRIKGVVFSPDGNIIATRRGGEVQLWDLTTHTLKLTLPNYSHVPLAFSPNGRTIVTGYRNEILLWNSTTGKLKNTLIGHAGPVKSATFSPDENTIATASQDGTVLIWDLTSHHLNSDKED